MAVREEKFATKSDVNRINNFMAVVVMALLIGFLVLLVTLALDFINAIRDDTSSRDTLIQEVQRLNDKLK